jgi:hypothetical protein
VRNIRSPENALQIAQDALDGEISFIEAARSLCGITRADPTIAEDDRRLFIAISSETDNLPVGRLRQEWHPDFLHEKDVEIARCEALWGNQIRSACERVRRTMLLKKLVVHWHVNVAERTVLGSVARQEVASLVKSILLTDGVFPDKDREGVVYEGAILARSSSGIQITWSRAYAWDPFTLAERRVEAFSDIDSAVEAFIDSEWKTGIDGIALK